MTSMRTIGCGVAIGLVLVLPGARWRAAAAQRRATNGKAAAAKAPAVTGGVPRYEFDPTWPKQPFPNAWMMGGGMGVAVDANDHIWVLHRPRELTALEAAASSLPPKAACCKFMPPVIE